MNIFAAALVMLAAVGCEKSETLPDNNSLGTTITLIATTNNGGTKTSLGDKNSDDQYPTLWSEGDAIAVINNGKMFEFTLQNGAGSTSGTFECTNATEFDADKPIQAFYPYSDSESVLKLTTLTTTVGTKDAFGYAIPAEQTYQAKSFGQGAMPMFAYASTANEPLQFINLFGALKLQLVGDESVKSITISSKSIATALTVASNDNGVSTTFQHQTSDPYSITLNCGNNGIKLSGNGTPTEFIIALPPISQELNPGKVTVSITTDSREGNPYVKESSMISIQRSNILKMPAIALAKYTDGNFSGESIALPKNETEYLIWAPVNCGYNSENNNKYGELYQWGRKYGQRITSTAVSGVLYSAADGSSEENKGNFYTAIVVDGNLTVDYHDWLSPRNGALWNGNQKNPLTSPTKTNYDPCPEGWRVPTINELKSLIPAAGTYSSYWTTSDGMQGFNFYGNTSKTTGNKIFMPAAGIRLREENEIQNVNSYGYYWSSTPDVGVETKSQILLFNDSKLVNFTSDYRAEGFSVRCIKE